MTRPTNPDHCRQVLATLARARRPLSAPDIADHLGVDGLSVETVRLVCKALAAAGEARRVPGRPARYERAVARAETEAL